MGMNDFWKLCIKNKSVTVPAIIIVSIMLLAVFAPMITQYDETRQDLLMRLMPPQSGHIFGTDELGRDVFTRILYGTRISLSIALFPTAIAVAVGTAMGILSAYFGKWVDFAIMRLADIMLSIPGMLLAMVWSGVLSRGSRGRRQKGYWKMIMCSRRGRWESEAMRSSSVIFSPI